MKRSRSSRMGTSSRGRKLTRGVTRKARRRAVAKKKGKALGGFASISSSKRVLLLKRRGVLGKMAKAESPRTVSRTGYEIILSRAPFIRELGKDDPKLRDALVSAYATGATTPWGSKG